MDCKDLGDRVELSVDFPGVKKEDINVKVDNDQLLICGKRKKEETRELERGGRSYCSYYGEFRRSLPLPRNVDENRIQAFLDAGVLKVVAPKKGGDFTGQSRSVNVR
jgi:HSP20 family protein